MEIFSRPTPRKWSQGQGPEKNQGFWPRKGSISEDFLKFGLVNDGFYLRSAEVGRGRSRSVVVGGGRSGFWLESV